LLAREVDHRAKNAMAIVQSIVRLTKTAEKADYAKAIEGRINALSRVHMILSDARWQGADIAKLIHDELAPYQSEDGKRITTEGGNIVLNPTVAQTLALVLHELATNAAKYGALSNADGCLAIRWSLSSGEIHILWKEQGGPVIDAARKKGFGTRIITSSVEAQLGGKAVFEWLREGLSCSFVVPYKSAIDTSRLAAEAFTRSDVSESIKARKILIVEDEALVAMALQDQLEALGLSVVATCANVPDALAAINSRLPDAAILDVNLGGQLVYPVADRLTELGIPHVFVTGYGRESIDQRYWATRTLEKPLDGDMLEHVFVRASTAEGGFKRRAAT
jgi:two-component sensor histidine kinase/CheY-like chemotaxis protein